MPFETKKRYEDTRYSYIIEELPQDSSLDAALFESLYSRALINFSHVLDLFKVLLGKLEQDVCSISLICLLLFIHNCEKSFVLSEYVSHVWFSITRVKFSAHIYGNIVALSHGSDQVVYGLFDALPF